MHKIYKFGGKTFDIKPVYLYFFTYAKNYECNEKAQYIIKNTMEEIKTWKITHHDTDGYPLFYIETLLIHTKVANILATQNIFIFHGSAIYLDSLDNAFIFTAKSGVGKSTHTRLLKEMFKDQINFINDDKPFLEKNDKNEFFVYGSPWDGKERISSNVKAHLKGIFILKRGNANKAFKINPKDAVNIMINQIYIPIGVNETNNGTLTSILLSSALPIYELEVDMSSDAPKASYEVMKKLKESKKKNET